VRGFLVLNSVGNTLVGSIANRNQFGFRRGRFVRQLPVRRHGQQQSFISITRSRRPTAS